MPVVPPFSRRGIALSDGPFGTSRSLAETAACGFPWCVACPHPGSDCHGCPTLLAGRHPFQYRIRHMVPRYSRPDMVAIRSEEHTSELQSLMRISYAVFCLKKKTKTTTLNNTQISTLIPTSTKS